MDEIDLQIINMLYVNSRISFRRLSEKLGLSTDTVIRRYQKLEKEGVIHPCIVVDYEKLGYQGIIFFFIRIIGQSNHERITGEIEKIPDVVGITRASGLYDLMVSACIKSTRHAFEIGRKIKQIGNIKKVAIDLFWLPPQEAAILPPPVWHNLQL